MSDLCALESPAPAVSPASPAAAARWARPDFEVIPLDCEITAYAPDDGDEPPLF